jgi:hypothetical protein
MSDAPGAIMPKETIRLEIAYIQAILAKQRRAANARRAILRGGE